MQAVNSKQETRDFFSWEPMKEASIQKKRETGMSNLSSRAENETRTRDPDLGKVVLYQLSYFRNETKNN